MPHRHYFASVLERGDFSNRCSVFSSEIIQYANFVHVRFPDNKIGKCVITDLIFLYFSTT
jgi:hypothetical protein